MIQASSASLVLMMLDVGMLATVAIVIAMANATPALTGPMAFASLARIVLTCRT